MKKKIFVAALFFGLFMASGSAVNYTCSDLTKCATLHDDATYDGENILLSVGEGMSEAFDRIKEIKKKLE